MHGYHSHSILSYETSGAQHESTEHAFDTHGHAVFGRSYKELDISLIGSSVTCRRKIGGRSLVLKRIRYACTRIFNQ
jgi:hypothetical protein